MQSSFEFEAGRLICGPIREMIESEIFYGSKIRYRESKGWFFRTFSIIGDAPDVTRLKSRLDHYKKCLEASHDRI